MKLPPLAIGIGAGAVAMLALAPFAGTALGNLARARAERDRLAVLAAGPEPQAVPLIAPGLAAGDDIAQLTGRIRMRANDAGVLVEEIRAGKRDGALIPLHLSFSGGEKAVVALADTLERDSVLLRLASWRIVPVEGGVRLVGEAVAVRR